MEPFRHSGPQKQAAILPASHQWSADSSSVCNFAQVRWHRPARERVIIQHLKTAHSGNVDANLETRTFHL